MAEDIKEAFQHIKKQIADLLINAGFVKSKSVFIRKAAGLTITIQIIKSRWNSNAGIKFWIEIAIYGTMLPGLSEEALIAGKTCLVRKNMGFYTNDENRAYVIDSNTDEQGLGREIVADLNAFVSLCAKFNSVFDVVDFLKKENERIGRNLHSFLIAVTLAVLGYKEESRPFFIESEGDKAAIKNWANYYGVEI